MAEEIQEAVQIIRVAYDGVEIAMKVGSGGINELKKVLEFFKGMLDYEKMLGKTSMKKLLTKGGDLQVMQFETKEMKKVKKYAKKYGILYSVLPDTKKDGLTEIIFHSEAVPRANMLIQKISSAKLATFDDFLKNGDKEQLGKLLDLLKNQKLDSNSEELSKVSDVMDNLIEKVGLYAMEKQSISIENVKNDLNIDNEEAEKVITQLEMMGVLDKKDKLGNYKVMLDKDAFINRINGYHQLADRIKAISSSKNNNLSDITISKQLIIEENGQAVKTRIPGTWGDKVRYIWLKKKNIMDIHNGKTMLTFLDKNKDYKIYDRKNCVVEIKKGEELYRNNYSSVSPSVKKHYEELSKNKNNSNRVKTTRSVNTRVTNERKR